MQSFISSGNIIFSSEKKDIAALEYEVEQAFTKTHGIEVATFIRSRDDLSAFIARNHFGELEHSKKTYLLVTFLKENTFDPGTITQALQDQVITAFDRDVNAVCSVVDTTAVKTPDFMQKLEKILSKRITSRTLNTVERIVKRF